MIRSPQLLYLEPFKEAVSQDLPAVILKLVTIKIIISLSSIKRDVVTHQKEKAGQGKCFIHIPPWFYILGCSCQPAIKETDNGKNREAEYDPDDSVMCRFQ